jgi:hypothetical protein
MDGCRETSSTSTTYNSLRNRVLAILAGEVPGCGIERVVFANGTCAVIDQRVDYGRLAAIQTLRPDKHIKEGGDDENRECRDDTDAK